MLVENCTAEMKESLVDPLTRLSCRGVSSLFYGAYLLERWGLTTPGQRLMRREVRSCQIRPARGHSSGSVFR